MRIEGSGKLLRIFVGETDRWEHRPLYTAIVEAARQAGLGGATVFKGIRAFLPRLDAMIAEGLVTIETVEVIAYRAGEPKRADG